MFMQRLAVPLFLLMPEYSPLAPLIPARLPAGIINGVSTVSRDSCLYAESFATREVLQRVRGANLTRVATGLDYYFGVINIAPENVTQEIFGFSTNSIQASLETQQAQSALALLNTTGVATLLNGTQAQVGIAGLTLASLMPVHCMPDFVALPLSCEARQSNSCNCTRVWLVPACAFL